jgi:hypothetical protein
MHLSGGSAFRNSGFAIRGGGLIGRGTVFRSGVGGVHAGVIGSGVRSGIHRNFTHVRHLRRGRSFVGAPFLYDDYYYPAFPG